MRTASKNLHTASLQSHETETEIDVCPCMSMRQTKREQEGEGEETQREREGGRERRRDIEGVCTKTTLTTSAQAKMHGCALLATEEHNKACMIACRAMRICRIKQARVCTRALRHTVAGLV